MFGLKQLSLLQKSSLAIGCLLCFELLLLFSLDRVLVDVEQELKQASRANNVANQVAKMKDSLVSLLCGNLYTRYVKGKVSTDSSGGMVRMSNHIRTIRLLLLDSHASQSAIELLNEVDRRMLHWLGASVSAHSNPQELISHAGALDIMCKEGAAVVELLDRISEGQVSAVGFSKQSERSRGVIRDAIALGAISNIAAALLLLAAFNLHVANRLSVINRNTELFAERKPLLGPLAGNDEIAIVDQSFRSMTRQLEDLDRLKRQFFASISHDIRSPLNSINATVSTLAESLELEIPDGARAKLNGASRSCSRIVGIVSDLLDFEKVEGGHVELHCEETQLEKCAGDSIENLTGLIEQKGLQLVKDFAPATVWGDSVWLTQVITNLLSNAVKYSPAGAALTVRITCDGELATVEVADNGPGIDEANQERIFQWFKQTAKQERSSKSSGLGLAIARRIVEQHAGRIGVRSTVGNGATFWFTVPLLAWSTRSAPAELPQPISTSADGVAAGRSAAQPGGPSAGSKCTGLLQKISSAISKIAGPYEPGRSLESQRQKKGLRIKEKQALAIAAVLLFELVQLFVLDRALLDAEHELGQALLAKMITVEGCRFYSKIGETMLERYLAVKDGDYNPNTLVHKIKDQAQVLRLLTRGVPNQAHYEAMILDLETRGLNVLLHTDMNSAALATGFSDFAQIKDHANEIFTQFQPDHAKGISADKIGSMGKSRQVLQQTILAGVVLNVGAVILLAMAFNSEIAKRLDVIRRNADRLSRREPLLEPLTGDDEIAMLDQSFHKMAEQLQELDTLKRQFFASISHDIRSPLSSIQATLLLLSETNYFELPDVVLARLSTASRSCSRVVQIVSELLDLEKIEEGHVELRFDEFPVEEPVESAIESLSGLIEAKHLEIKTKIEPVLLWGDLAWLTQVATNLLGNAIKFSPDGACITITASVQHDFVRCEVVDQGPGMEPGHCESIFDWFKQSPDQKRSRGASGLGLAIARRIVEQHGGTIGAISTPGAGATFWFSLPLTAKPLQSAGGRNSDQRASPVSTVVGAGAFEMFGLMALPVLPLLVLFIVIVFAASSDRDERKRLKAQCLRSDNGWMEVANDEGQGLRICLQGCALEKNSEGGLLFPGSYYDCARWFLRAHNSGSAAEMLHEGLRLLNRYQGASTMNAAQLQALACERMKIYSLSGDLNFAAGKFEAAEADYVKAFSCGSLTRAVSAASFWVGLRVAARSWLKCPQCRVENDYNRNAVARLVNGLTKEEKCLVGVILDVFFVLPDEGNQWLTLQSTVQNLMNAGQQKEADELMARYLHLSPPNSIQTARRVFQLGQLYSWMIKDDLALQHFDRAADLLQNSVLPNAVVVTQSLQYAAEEADRLHDKIGAARCLQLARRAVAEAKKVLPSDRLLVSEVECALINCLKSNKLNSEARVVAGQRYEQMLRDFAEDRQSGEQLSQATLDYLGTIDEGTKAGLQETEKLRRETLEVIRTHCPSVAVRRTESLLEGLLSTLRNLEELATNEAERLSFCNSAVQVYERFSYLLEKKDTSRCRLFHARALALLQMSKGQIPECIATCQTAVHSYWAGLHAGLADDIAKIEMQARQKQKATSTTTGSN